METRNILDYLGNVIGELSLPIGTSEDSWSLALSPYALPPSTYNPTVETGTVVKSEQSSELSTSSSSFQNIPDIQLTPLTGTYLVTLTVASTTSGVNTKGEFRLTIDENPILNTTRPIQAKSEILGLVTLSLCEVQGTTSIQTKVILNGSETIIPQFRMVSGTSIKIFDRALTIQRVNDDAV